MRTLRVLAILTKRQIAEDGPYLVAALLVPPALIVATAILAFFDNPYVGVNLYLPVPTVCLLGVLLVLVCGASYLFGVKQVHADQASGISAMLSALPVRGNQILIARVVTGTLFLLIVFIFLVSLVAGAVLLDILPGRDWVRYRSSEWSLSFLAHVLVWTLVSAFLIAWTCYCLGLRRARTVPSVPRALDGLLAIPILILLVIIKGFTPVFVAILLSLIVLSLLALGLGRRPFIACAITTGLIECILISVPLFCGRYVCDVMLAEHAASRSPLVKIQSWSLLPPGVPSDRLSVARGEIRDRYLLPQSSIKIPILLHTLGIVESIESRLPRGFAAFNSRGSYWMLYFDEALGQMVDQSRRSGLYIGPQGTASVPDDRIGRFVAPLLGEGIGYDRGAKRFWSMDRDDWTVKWGPKSEDASWEPIYIFQDPSKARMCWVGWEGGRIASGCDAVLDCSGRIAWLSRSTLETRKWAAYLPRPFTFFGRGSGQPKDLLDYDVVLVGDSLKGEYAGMVVGSLSRQGTALTLAIFDKDGKEVRTASSRTNLFGTFSEATLAIEKYFFESLHPPALTMASFFAAYSFDARSTHRALFLMPNSFVALQRDRETSRIVQFCVALLFLLPALVLSGFLCWWVVRDAAVMGVSRRARWLCGLGTLAFGLPAYITYRLTRPRSALSLCGNCGRGRRVDLDVCHHCGSGWDVPALEPPAWRVMSASARSPAASR